MQSVSESQIMISGGHCSTPVDIEEELISKVDLSGNGNVGNLVCVNALDLCMKIVPPQPPADFGNGGA